MWQSELVAEELSKGVLVVHGAHLQHGGVCVRLEGPGRHRGLLHQALQKVLRVQLPGEGKEGGGRHHLDRDLLVQCAADTGPQHRIALCGDMRAGCAYIQRVQALFKLALHEGGVLLEELLCAPLVPVSRCLQCGPKTGARVRASDTWR